MSANAPGSPWPGDPGLSAPPAALVNVLDPKYGAKGDYITDESDHIQAAVNAASAKSLNLSGAPVDVWLPSGYGFKWSKLTLNSGARLRCDGAVIAPSATLDANGMIQASTAPLVNSGIIGGLWAGAGTETVKQFLFQALGNVAVQDCRFTDMQITGWGVGPLYIRNPSRVHVLRNALVNVGPSATNTSHYNAINLVFDGSAATTGKNIVTGNIVDGAGDAGSISVVITNAGVAGTLPHIIAHNIVSGNASENTVGSNTGCIGIEVDVATTVSEFLIVDNDVTAWATDAAIIFASGAAGGNVQRATARGNRVTNNNTLAGHTSACIANFGAASDVEAIDNQFTPSAVGVPTSGTFALKTGNRYTTGALQGRATLVAGTVTVNTAEIQANDNILLSYVNSGSTGVLRISAIVPGVSFTIASSQGADVGTVYWRIDH